MWAFLTGLLGLADPIAKIGQAIADERVALAKAQTDKERIDSEERIRVLEARADVLKADASRSSLDMFVRAGFALPFIVYNAKLVLWDKVLAFGSTDPLSSDLAKVEMVVIGFYFLHSIATGRR
jgi:hypothetical protein